MHGLLVDEWPVYESDDFPREAVELLQQFNIAVEVNQDDLSQENQENHNGGVDYSQSEARRVATVADVLGRYYIDYEIIVLFPRVIEACANSLGVSYSSLYDVVLAHETAHAVTHLCPTTKVKPASYKWNSFGSATSESAELLAQLIPFRYFEQQNLKHHLDAMEKLSAHQTAKYNSYKTHAPLISSKNSLFKLIIHLRQEQEKKVRSSPTFEPEWWLEYQVEGDKLHSIRDSGVVLLSRNLEVMDGLDYLERDFMRNQVSITTLREIKAKIDDIVSLSIDEMDFEERSARTRRGRKSPTTKVMFSIDGDRSLKYQCKAGNWQGHERAFEGLILLIDKALSEAR